MTNRSKAKGTAAETALVDWLRVSGFPEARREVLHGAKDVGDTGGLPVTVEVKNCATLAIPQWLREVATENANAGKPMGVVVAKPRGVGWPGKWWAIQTADDYFRMVRMVEGRQGWVA